MTAEQTENALAGQALAGGEAESAAWTSHAEGMQREISGSAVDTSDSGRGPDDGAVLGWTGSDRHPGPGPSPQP